MHTHILIWQHSPHYLQSIIKFRMDIELLATTNGQTTAIESTAAGMHDDGRPSTVIDGDGRATMAMTIRSNQHADGVMAKSQAMAEDGVIRDYSWIGFKLEREAFYMKEFRDLHSDDVLDKKSLGMEMSKMRERTPSPETKEQEEKSQPGEFLKKRAMPDLEVGFATRGFAKVINAIEERINKFGMLGEDDDCIRRKQHNNDEFYEQDEFIDDPVDQIALQTMDFLISRYDDYFFVKGNLELFKKNKKFTERIAEVKLRNRESRSKKNEENKKKREAQQIQSIMKGDKKDQPEESAAKTPSKSKPKPTTSDKIAKPKKATAKSSSKPQKQPSVIETSQTDPAK